MAVNEADLLAAIRDQPDADAPRLAYADWCEGHGDAARAEMVRAQVEAARLPEAHPRREELFRRAAELIGESAARWLAGLPQGRNVQWSFERGLPERVRFDSMAAFERHIRDVSCRVRLVELVLRDVARLARSPGLAFVRELRLWSIGGEPGDVEVRAILASPHLGRLRRLEVTSTSLTDYDLAALAARPALAGMRHLSVGTYSHSPPLSFTWAGMAALAASPHLRQLESLSLQRGGLNDDAGAALLSGSFRRLERLDLYGNQLGPASLAALGDGAGLPALRRLNLADNQLDDAAVAALARARRMAALRELDLSHNRVGPAGVEALAAANHLRRVEWLDLADNGIGDAGASALAGWRLRALEGLNVSHNLIHDAGMTALGQSRSLPRLTYFKGHDNPARRALILAVAERFANHGPPLEDAPAVPAVPAAPAAVVGDADEDGLVRAILADPRDDAARLVYADWLEEHGGADHATLLRLCCGHHAAASGRRVRDLRAKLDAAARAAMPRCKWVSVDQGLIVAQVPVRSVASRAFQEKGPGWMRLHHISLMTLCGRTKDWSRLADAAALAHVRGLSVPSADLGLEGAAALGASSHLRGLCHLELLGDMAAEGIVRLFAGGRLSGLCSLDLSYTHPGTEGLRAAAERPGAENLRRLDLNGTYCGDAAVAVLAAAPRLANLTTLDLGACGLTDRGLEVLADSSLARRLRWLSLTGNPALSGDAVLALARGLGPDGRLVVTQRPIPPACRREIGEMLGERIAWR